LCALVAFGALTFNQVVGSKAFAEPAQAKVDYSKGYPPKAPGASHLDLPNPIPLGDPKSSDQWGHDDKYGIANLTHQNHTEKYKIECSVCHHTNGKGNAATGEEVERCVNCHKAEGDENNPVSGDGVELNVKEAFHVGETGCIECHKREEAKNPQTKAVSSCSGCHQAKG
jgi:hypothetical protein